MLSSALVGGVLLALIEGAGIAMSHYTADNYRQISVLERMQHYNERQMRQQQQQQQQISSFYAEQNEASLIKCIPFLFCLVSFLAFCVLCLFFFTGQLVAGLDNPPHHRSIGSTTIEYKC